MNFGSNSPEIARLAGQPGPQNCAVFLLTSGGVTCEDVIAPEPGRCQQREPPFPARRPRAAPVTWPQLCREDGGQVSPGAVYRVLSSASSGTCQKGQGCSSERPLGWQVWGCLGHDCVCFHFPSVVQERGSECQRLTRAFTVDLTCPLSQAHSVLTSS